MENENADKVKAHLEKIISSRCPEILNTKPAFQEAILANKEYAELISINIQNQQKIIDDMQLRFRVENIKETHIMLPNGRSGQPYQFYLPIEKLEGWDEITDIEIEGLEAVGLEYDSRTQTVTGTPTQSGDSKVALKFRLEEGGEWYEKKMMLIINPDPKSLWKNLDSDKKARFWKEDNVSTAEKFGDKNIVAASKRGRSHANVGSFRDDDFAFEHFADTGWSVIAVADGAGSAKCSREGSRVACQQVIENFTEEFTEEVRTQFDEIIADWHDETSENGEQKLSQFVSKHLGRMAFDVHKKLKVTAENAEIELKDLNSTLIFCLLKKVDAGYVVLSFGVGDCPIVLLDKEMKEVTLLNKLDVGEYGGGTRFITMPSIFSSPDFYNIRFSFKIISDFSYLMLMTDGIYDPKFEVEANLEKIEKWQGFLQDLKGENADGKAVDFSVGNEEVGVQLSDWMDFWSVGNHDDRTLVVVY